MSFGKKYKKTSLNILEKEKYLQKELLKTGMLHELRNTTSGVYSVVNTHDEIPYTPAVYSDVPDTSGIRGGSWTQTIGGDGVVPEDGGVWANPGYQTNGDLKNANELDGQTNRPIFDTPWNTQANGEAGILFYQGVHNAHYYTVDANNNRKSYSASDDSDEAIAWRAGLAAVKTYPPGPEWKAYKYWVPFSIFNPRIDAYWPEGDNTPKYTGVVCGNPDNGTARALMTDWLYVGASNNQYMSTPAVSNTPAYTTILSRNSIDDASYYAGDPKDYLRGLMNVGSTAYDWIKDKATSWYSKGQSFSSPDTGDTGPGLFSWSNFASGASAAAGKIKDIIRDLDALGDQIRGKTTHNASLGVSILTNRPQINHTYDSDQKALVNQLTSFMFASGRVSVNSTQQGYADENIYQDPKDGKYKPNNGQYSDNTNNVLGNFEEANIKFQPAIGTYGNAHVQVVIPPGSTDLSNATVYYHDAGYANPDSKDEGEFPGATESVYNTLSAIGKRFHGDKPMSGQEEFPFNNLTITQFEQPASELPQASKDYLQGLIDAGKVEGNNAAYGRDKTIDAPTEKPKSQEPAPFSQNDIGALKDQIEKSMSDEKKQSSTLSGDAETQKMTKDFIQDIINAGPSEIQRSLSDIRTQKNVPNKQFIIKSWEKALQSKSQTKVDADPDPWSTDNILKKMGAEVGKTSGLDPISGKVLVDIIRGGAPGAARDHAIKQLQKHAPAALDKLMKKGFVKNKKKKTVVTASFDWMQHENMMSEEYLLRVTRKDLARNHKLTDKEISEWMETIRAINIWLKIHPQKLNYAKIRYPADDPRLAELNFKMDQMQEASKEYIDMQFPVNQSIVRRIKQMTKKNIDDTDPKKFKSVKQPPKYLQLDIDFNKILKLKETTTRHFKKPVKIKSWYKKGS